jgi:hypothetical protein
LFGPAPADISGAEASYRTLPWGALLVVGTVIVALVLPDNLAGGVLIVLVVALVSAGWWIRVGRQWHPIDRLRKWRMWSRLQCC